jgi:site-specific recombinase XerD
MPQPTVYSAEEISRVENSFDLTAPNGIRNYAITLLMTRYGIRACDVAALTIDNVDFANNRLRFIQQKTNEPWEGELISEAKTALQNYITNVRPNINECSQIFITLSVPYAPIGGSHINTMIGQQFQNANINIAGKRHGSRAFRSSIASNMINDGVPTEVVRNILGHETEYAIKHYARIDIERMRFCALSVPEPMGIFAQMLSGKKAIFHV